MDKPAQELPAVSPSPLGTPDDVPARPQRWRWLAVLCALLIVAGPMLVAGVPVEISRWYQAAAREADLNGDFALAVQRQGQAIRWCPYDPKLRVRRAELRLKMHDLAGSLEDCNGALEAATGGDVIAALVQRMRTYQRLGRHADALVDTDRIVEIVSQAPDNEVALDDGSAVNYPVALNYRAYARALANQDVAAGLADIERAFQLLGSENEWAFLDTRGYLRYLQGDVAAALPDLDRAVQMAEAERGRFHARQTQLLAEGLDAKTLQRLNEQQDQNLAVMYHHRGLALQKLGREAEAQQQLARADELGYDPNNGVW